MKTTFISKLFYRKYPYKITIRAGWVGDLKYKDLAYFKKLKDKHANKEVYNPFIYKQDDIKQIKDQIHLIEKIYQYIKLPNTKTRTEYNCFTFFIDDADIFNQIKTELSSIISEIFVPYNDIVLKELLNKNSIEIKSSLTHECRYKIILKFPKTEFKDESRINFLNLINRNRDLFVLTYNTKYALEHNKLHYLDNTLLYVKDSKFLIMTQFMIQPIIKEVVSMFTYDEITNKEEYHEQD
jgi:hypothetical protein